jgi:hypothetical protein
LQLTPSLPARSFYSNPRGRSTSCGRICLASFKKRPHGPALAMPKGHNENCWEVLVRFSNHTLFWERRGGFYEGLIFKSLIFFNSSINCGAYSLVRRRVSASFDPVGFIKRPSAPALNMATASFISDFRV